MKKRIIYITTSLLIAFASASSANAQEVFIEKSGHKNHSKGEMVLVLDNDNTFRFFSYLNLYQGVWENTNKKKLLLHFDENKKIVHNQSHPRMVFKGDYKVKIINDNKLKLNGYIFTKIPWSTSPATLTLRDSVFTFNINNISYNGVWEQKNDRVSILHLNKDSETFFPLEKEAISKILGEEEFNFDMEEDEFLQTKIPWIPEGKDIRLELINDGTFSFLYRRKFYIGQWSRNTEKEIKLQFDIIQESKTLWNMGYFEIDKSDPKIFAVFDSVEKEVGIHPRMRLQLNKDHTLILLQVQHIDTGSRSIDTGTWSNPNDKILRMFLDRSKRGCMDAIIINSDELKLHDRILKKQ